MTKLEIFLAAIPSINFPVPRPENKAVGPRISLLVPVLSLPDVKVSVPLRVSFPFPFNVKPFELFNVKF